MVFLFIDDAILQRLKEILEAVQRPDALKFVPQKNRDSSCSTRLGFAENFYFVIMRWTSGYSIVVRRKGLTYRDQLSSISKWQVAQEGVTL